MGDNILLKVATLSFHHALKMASEPDMYSSTLGWSVNTP